MVTANSTGRSIGSTTRHKIVQVPAPMSRAASIARRGARKSIGWLSWSMSPQLDVGGERRPEVGVDGVQPREHGRPDPRGAQGEGLADVGDAQGVGAGLEGRPGHGHRTVAVGVGLDHGHEPGGGGEVTEPAHVGADGGEVDHGAALARLPLWHRRPRARTGAPGPAARVEPCPPRPATSC